MSTHDWAEIAILWVYGAVLLAWLVAGAVLLVRRWRR